MIPARRSAAVALGLGLALCASGARASGPWVSVFPPSSAEADARLADDVAASLREALTKLRRYPVLPKSDTEALPGLGEMLAEAGCWERPSCPAEVGGVVGARVVVGGLLKRAESGLTLTLHAFHVERGQALGREELTAASDEALLEGLAEAVDRLVPAPAAEPPPPTGTVVVAPEDKPPAEAKPAEKPPAETAPAEAKPAEKKPDETKPAEKPSAVAKADPQPEQNENLKPPPGMPAGKSEKKVEEESKTRIVTWIAAAGAAAMFGAGIYYGIKNKQIVDEANDQDLNAISPEKYKKDYYDPSWEAADRANIFLGVGGGLAAAAIVLFFVEPYFYGKKDDGAKAMLLPAPGGLAVSGRF